MNWFLFKAVIKARKNGLLHLRPATKPTRVECLADKCAKCCRLLGTPKTTPEEAEKIGRQHILEEKNTLFIRSEHSVCCLLKDGLCTIYANRPRSCREYPWYNIDGQLYFDAGCPGIIHDENDQRPDPKNIQPFESFFPQMPKPLYNLIKKICLR